MVGGLLEARASVYSDTIRNRLLACLPPDAFERLRPHLSRVILNRHQILQEPNRSSDYAYFIERGVAFLFARTQRDGPVEVGMIGRFGLVGWSIVLGTMRSPYRCLMHIEGEALRIEAEELRRAIDEHRELQQKLLTFIQGLLVQSTQTILCNARHEIKERVSRWLLLARDRLDDDAVPITHDLLAMMLGVRRAGISTALTGLEDAGTIHRSRGAVQIVDRAALEQRACECYRIIAAEYDRCTRSCRAF